jgi:hypothetical protein
MCASPLAIFLPLSRTLCSRTDAPARQARPEDELYSRNLHRSPTVSAYRNRELCYGTSCPLSCGGISLAIFRMTRAPQQQSELAINDGTRSGCNQRTPLSPCPSHHLWDQPGAGGGFGPFSCAQSRQPTSSRWLRRAVIAEASSDRRPLRRACVSNTIRSSIPCKAKLCTLLVPDASGPLLDRSHRRSHRLSAWGIDASDGTSESTLLL